MAAAKREELFSQASRFLASIDPRVRGEYEIEARIGFFNDRGFNSNVDSKVFYRVLEHFTSHPDIFILDGPTKTDEYSYATDVPGVTMRDTTLDGSSDHQYSTKERITSFDFTNEFVRVAVSKETILYTGSDAPPHGPTVGFRKKTRWSFYVNEKLATHRLAPFRVDLTHVVGWYSGPGRRQDVISNEIELELLPDHDINDFKTQVWPGIQNMLEIVQNTPFIMSSKTLDSVMSRFKELFAGGNPYKIVNKPIDLELENLEHADLLAVTDKADGERKLMFIDPRGAFLIYPPKDIFLFMPVVKDPRHPTLWMDPDFAKKWDGTVLDGELVTASNGNVEYLAFDILYKTGQDLRKLPFLKRLAELQKIVPKTTHPEDYKRGMGGSKGDERSETPLKRKTFLLPTDGPFNARVDSILTKIENPEMWPYGNDGLIFNDITTDYYSNVYKWKPPHLLTIDFSVKIIGNTDNKVFELYTKGPNGLELFRGTSKYPFDGTTTGLTVENGQIVELQWNSETNEFVQFKIRHDRESPNNTSTAQNVWEHIQNPILESVIRGTVEPPKEVFQRKTKKLAGLGNVNNSCFFDSVLVPILLTNGWLFEQMTEKKSTCAGLEKHLVELAKKLENPETDLTCTSTLKVLKKCSSQLSELLSGNQQDASELLLALLDLYDLHPITIERRRYMGNDPDNLDLVKSEVEHIAAIPVPIGAPNLVSATRTVDITDNGDSERDDWPKNSSGEPCQYIKTIEKVTSAEILIFIVPPKQKVNASEYIRGPNDRLYTLNQVILHHGSRTGGHYTCYFKKGDRWYFYDDLEEPESRITLSMWPTVKAHSANNGVAFIYS